LRAADGSPIATLQPGMSLELDPGQDVKFANPPEAGTTYSDYMRTQHLGTAAGAGLPYELFSGDIVNVSDRTLRVIVNEFRRFAKQRQWQILIPMLCDRVRAAWALQAQVGGALSQAEAEAAVDASSGRRTGGNTSTRCRTRRARRSRSKTASGPLERHRRARRRP
jgi:capsid protein